MPSQLHNQITNAIKKIGDELTKKIKIKTRFEKVLDGNENHIKIINPETRRLMGINYYPDVYYITKLNKLLIFEVIDKENQNNIIADTIQAFLSPNIWGAIFIATSKEKVDETIDIMKTIEGALRQKGFSKIPYYTIYLIDREHFQDYKLVKREVKKILREWYTPRKIE